MGDTPISACTCFVVRRAARHMTQMYDTHLAPTGLRITQYSLLNALTTGGPLSLGGLAARMGMDRTTLGRNLRPLERDGLVTIEVDPADRRGRAVALTPAATIRLAEARDRWHAAQAAFEARYGAAATQDLHTTLDSLAALEFGPAR